MIKLSDFSQIAVKNLCKQNKIVEVKQNLILLLCVFIDTST
jgi:hypothetical protein